MLPKIISQLKAKAAATFAECEAAAAIGNQPCGWAVYYLYTITLGLSSNIAHIKAGRPHNGGVLWRGERDGLPVRSGGGWS